MKEEVFFAIRYANIIDMKKVCQSLNISFSKSFGFYNNRLIARDGGYIVKEGDWLYLKTKDYSFFYRSPDYVFTKIFKYSYKHNDNII